MAETDRSARQPGWRWRRPAAASSRVRGRVTVDTRRLDRTGWCRGREQPHGKQGAPSLGPGWEAASARLGCQRERKRERERKERNRERGEGEVEKSWWSGFGKESVEADFEALSIFDLFCVFYGLPRLLGLVCPPLFSTSLFLDAFFDSELPSKDGNT